MKKLNFLLHDVTVINFKVVGKLFVRFYKISIVFFILAAVVANFIYFNQETIYQKESYFKILLPVSETQKSSPLAELIDGGTSFMKKPEIMAMITETNFVTTLVDQVVTSQRFDTLDFRSPVSNMKGILVSESQSIKSFKACTDLACKKKYLREILPSLLSLDSEMGTTRFKLTVATHSRETTLVVLSAFKSALEMTRQKEVSDSLNQQIAQVQDLITKSHSEIELKGGFEKVASRDFINALVEEKSLGVRSLAERLSKEQEQFNYQKIRLRQSSIAAQSEIEGDEKLSYEKFSKLKKRVEEIRLNIASISSIPEVSRTQTDNLILSQLKEELSNSEKSLQDLGKIKRNVSFEDTFISNQMNNQTNFEFDYKVSSEKLRKLEEEYQKAKKELDDLFVKKTTMSTDLTALQPDLEYLKLLESKLVTMKMKKSALTSDVSFDEISLDVQSYTKNSYAKIAIFTFFFVFFLSFLSIIVLYVFDDRIYDKEELEKCCGDMPIIGNVPHFE